MNNTHVILISVVALLSICSCRQEEKFIRYPVELISPMEGAVDQSPDVMLKWHNPNPKSTSAHIYHYDVYLGKSPDNLQLIATDLVAFQDSAMFECGALKLNTRYFWKIRSKVNGNIQASPLLMFTTTDQLPAIEFYDFRLMVYPYDYVYEDPDSTTYEISLYPSGASSQADGQANTLAIINEYDQYPSGVVYKIAQFCNSLQAYGYDDWYLPSIVELDSLAKNHLLSKAERSFYWSSTEDERQPYNTYILQIDRNFSYNLSVNKTYKADYKCRCIRRD